MGLKPGSLTEVYAYATLVGSLVKIGGRLRLVHVMRPTRLYDRLKRNDFIVCTMPLLLMHWTNNSSNRIQQHTCLMTSKLVHCYSLIKHRFCSLRLVFYMQIFCLLHLRQFKGQKSSANGKLITSYYLTFFICHRL